jgi:hypothetical protein
MPRSSAPSTSAEDITHLRSHLHRSRRPPRCSLQ